MNAILNIKARVKYNPDYIQLADLTKKIEAVGHPVQYVSQPRPIEKH